MNDIYETQFIKKDNNFTNYHRFTVFIKEVDCVIVGYKYLEDNTIEVIVKKLSNDFKECFKKTTEKVGLMSNLTSYQFELNFEELVLNSEQVSESEKIVLEFRKLFRGVL